MPFAALDTVGDDFGATMVALVASEGSAAHPYAHSVELNAGASATRNAADLLHLLSLLHGRHPGPLEIAAERNPVGQADSWFMQASAGFSVERDYMARLIVAAGPVPGTPGEAESAAAMLAQRNALTTIAASDRFGCAIGAAAGQVLDWQAVRAVLDTVADRLGLTPPACMLPDEAETGFMLAALPPHARLDRTLTFGARQVLVQHHGLWELAEARAGAREA